MVDTVQDLQTDVQTDVRTIEEKEKIKSFILRFSQKQDLKDDDDIFSFGFVNSLFAIQLITFLEKTYLIKIENDDLDISNFRTVTSIAQFIHKRGGNSIARNCY